MIAALSQAWRSVRARPSVSLAVVVSMATGLAASAVVFAVMDAAVLRPFPFPQPDRLVGIGAAFPRLNRPLEFFEALSGPEHDAIARDARSLDDVTGFDLGNEPVMIGDTPERVFTASFWEDPVAVLRVAPLAGRGFTPEELSAGAPVAVVSHAFWRDVLGGDPAVTGTLLRVGGRPYTIVGVMPPRVRLYGTDLWIPMRDAAASLPQNRRQFNVIARMRPGVGIGTVNAELEAAARRIELDHAAAHGEYRGLTLEARPWTEIEVWGYGRVTGIALAATLLLLALLTANLANLLLARALDRRREMAVRTALGATRQGLVAQMLAETTVLSAAGVAAGLLLAWVGVRIVSATLGDLMPDTAVVHVSGRVVAFLAAAGAITAALLSIVPAAQLTRRDVGDALSADGGRTIGGGSRRLRQWLVAIEATIAVVVAGTASLLAVQVSRVLAVDPGFPLNHLLTARVTLPLPQYDGRSMVFFDAVLERLRAMPSIADASVSNQPPPGVFSRAQFAIEGAPSSEQLPAAFFTTAGPRYRETLGLELVRGRWFDERAAREGAREVVVNEAAAARFFDGADPVGQRVRISPPHSDQQPATIVGVVRSVRNRGLSVPPAPEIIASVRQIPDRRQSQLYIVARGRAGTEGLLDAIRSAIRASDPAQPVYAVSTIAAQYREGLGVRRAAASLLATFAALALGLAALGIFSVLSHTVGARTREIGIRAALGATRGRLTRMVVADSLGPVLAGASAGIAIMLAGTRVLANQVFGIEPEVGPLALTIALLVLVAILASAIPARRAGRVDPADELRH